MRIAENILKHSLQNVFFLAGTVLGGKTTMAKALAEKHGLLFFSEDWYTDSFLTFQAIIDERYQPLTHMGGKKDLEAYYSQPAEAFLADFTSRNGNDEYIEYAIVELIKLSQTQRVVTDILIPIRLLAEISDYRRSACLVATPELISAAQYGQRESHRAFLDMLLSLENPDQKIAVQDTFLKAYARETDEEVRRHHLFRVVRTAESTVEGTLRVLEAHFQLPGRP